MSIVSLALFENRRVICFGDSYSGRLGTDHELNVAGFGGPVLSLQPYISFSDNSLATSYVSAGSAHTCVFRCDGKMLCFGQNMKGQLGRDSTVAWGKAAGEMTQLYPVGLPAALTLDTPDCSARIAGFTSPVLPLFDPYVTQYLFAVSATVETLSFVPTATSPPTIATVTVNNNSPSVPVSLTSMMLNRVIIFLLFSTRE